MNEAENSRVSCLVILAPAMPQSEGFLVHSNVSAAYIQQLISIRHRIFECCSSGWTGLKNYDTSTLKVLPIPIE